MLKIYPKHTNLTGSLHLEIDGQEAGRIDFVPLAPGVLDLNHTEVATAFEGQGYGRKLVEAAVQLARSEGQTLVASCPYAAKVLGSNPAYSDVWKKL